MEVNTLNSKISDAEIRWLAVDSKAALNGCCEQIQNLVIKMNYKLVHVGFGNMVVAEIVAHKPLLCPHKDSRKRPERPDFLLMLLREGRPGLS